jgi:alpha-mannosidase
MDLRREQVRQRIAALNDQRYRDAFSIRDWERIISPQESDAVSVMRLGDRWSGRDTYLTLKAHVRIPESWPSGRVVGLFDFGRSGGGNNSGFESLLWIDDRRYQAVDSNHAEVFLPDDAPGRGLALVMQLWSGLEGGGPRHEQHYQLRRADVAWCDPVVDDL